MHTLLMHEWLKLLPHLQAHFKHRNAHNIYIYGLQACKHNFHTHANTRTCTCTHMHTFKDFFFVTSKLSIYVFNVHACVPYEMRSLPEWHAHTNTYFYLLDIYTVIVHVLTCYV